MPNVTKMKPQYLVIILVAVLLLLPLVKLTVNAIGNSAEVGEKEIRTFVEQLGWELSAEAPDVQNIVIPQQFSEVYTQYNELQKQSGYDLSRYSGESAVKYTYSVLNCRDESGNIAENIHANVLVCGSRIIGGDICSLGLDGFMHPLRKNDPVVGTG